MEIHERLGPEIWKRLGLWSQLDHIWAAAYAPLFGLIGLLVLFLAVQHRREVPAFLVLTLAALSLWAGALGLELMQLTFLPSLRPWYSMAVYLEEAFEMVATSLFLLGSVLVLRHVIMDSAQESIPTDIVSPLSPSAPRHGSSATTMQ